MLAPEPVYPNEHAVDETVLSTLRDLLNQCFGAIWEDSETLYEKPWTRGYLPYLPDAVDAATAQEALLVDDEVLS